MRYTNPNLNKKTRKYRKHKKNFKKRQLTFKKAMCSPSSQKSGFTCLQDESLLKLKNLWNARHPDDKIENKTSHEIWLNLRDKMNSVCDSEMCWLKQKFVDGKLNHEITDNFAPEAPKKWEKNPNEWLSSIEIIKVMKQYEKKYKCFEFIGPSPIDYDSHYIDGECVWEDLCHFDLQKEINKGKSKVGIIFNTDPHTKPGQHWISMFINVKKQKIFFFDSVGDPAPEEAMRFVKKVQQQGEAIGKKLVFDQNHPVEHQYGDGQCGIYALYFIIHMLEDKANEGEYFKTHIIPDKYISKFRKVYFNG
jgi:hypothetical protein